MSSYAASAKLRGIVPHAAHSRAGGAHDALEPDGDSAHKEARRRPGSLTEIVGRPMDMRLADRWARLCEAWSQTTFFLFDPDSWR